MTRASRRGKKRRPRTWMLSSDSAPLSYAGEPGMKKTSGVDGRFGVEEVTTSCPSVRALLGSSASLGPAVAALFSFSTQGRGTRKTSGNVRRKFAHGVSDVCACRGRPHSLGTTHATFARVQHPKRECERQKRVVSRLLHGGTPFSKVRQATSAVAVPWAQRVPSDSSSCRACAKCRSNPRVRYELGVCAEEMKGSDIWRSGY